MAAVILQVIDYKREKINGTLMDRYKLKLKDGDRVYETLGFRHSSHLVLQPGQLLENMREVGELSSEDFAKEWYEAKEIEQAKLHRKEQLKKDDGFKKAMKKAEAIVKEKVLQPVRCVPEQMSLF